MIKNEPVRNTKRLEVNTRLAKVGLKKRIRANENARIAIREIIQEINPNFDEQLIEKLMQVRQR